MLNRYQEGYSRGWHKAMSDRDAADMTPIEDALTQARLKVALEDQRNAVIEECAKVAEQHVATKRWTPIRSQIAAAIRALKDK